MRPEPTMNPLPMRFVVGDLDAGIRFYSAMFASAPVELEPGCARWNVGRGDGVTIAAPERASRPAAVPEARRSDRGSR